MEERIAMTEPRTPAELIAMANDWPLLATGDGLYLTGDLLIHRLGEALDAALRSSLPPEPWRPISEAPQVRHARLLLYSRQREVHFGQWDDTIEGEGWLTHPWRHSTSPTHWQPLPSPPRAGEEPRT